MQNKGFFSQDRNEIEKLIIRRLREKYIPQFQKELSENDNVNDAEKLFQHFLTQIRSTGFMDKMIQNFYEIKLNQKMSGLNLNNSKN